MNRTVRHLADGREIIYFDQPGAPERVAEDTRDLPPVSATSEIRRDPLTGEWVAMAAHRQTRTYKPPADLCPLCPSKPGKPSEIPESDYDVVVFENRFPSLVQVPGEDDTVTHLDGEELWPVRPAAGRTEVICFSPDPDASLATVGHRRMRTVVEAWADRTTELGAIPGIEQVFCFENRGKEIGVTLHHPHGQIYGYPYLTPRTATMLRQARAHREATGRNLLRDVLEAELRSGRRVVTESEHWVAYVPAAARWPVEVHLAPRRDVPDLPALTDAERADLADVYLRLLRAGDQFFVTTETDGEQRALQLPYISAWHQAPVREGREDLRLHLQLFSVLRAPGKLKYLAGSESGMGAWVSDTTPERIADRYREVVE